MVIMKWLISKLQGLVKLEYIMTSVNNTLDFLDTDEFVIVSELEVPKIESKKKARLIR